MDSMVGTAGITLVTTTSKSAYENRYGKTTNIGYQQTSEAEKFFEGLELAGAHQISGDGMGPAVTNGRKAAKNVLDDMKKKEAAK